MENKRGGISLTWGIVLILIIVGVMIYTLVPTRNPSNIETARGTQTPSVSQHTSGDMFSDGLHNPHQVAHGTLDETGNGISEQEIFYTDVNQDNFTDKIIRTHYENGTGHAWDEYNIQIVQNGQYVDITPSDFRTVNGADCALQKIQFVFHPDFQIIKISRPWVDSWNTPSMATRTLYEIKNDRLVLKKSETLRTVCDVTELFNHK